MTEEKFQYENLSFEGGGSKGFAYIGAITALSELNYLSRFKRFSGSSIGALFATMLCIGYTSSDIKSKVNMFTKNLVDDKCILTKLYCIFRHYGMHSTDKLRERCGRILEKKVDVGVTFADLYRLTQKDLVIVGCCLNRKTPIYFHHRSHPNVKVIDALIITMSFPLYFQPIQHDFMGTIDYYVDGGLVDNYPIWVFNDEKLLSEGKIDDIDDSFVSDKTLGLKLLGISEKHNPNVFEGRTYLKNIIDYGVSIVNNAIMQVERSQISVSYLKNTIAIPAGDVNVLDTDMSSIKKQYLINSGYHSVMDRLKK